MQTLVDPFEVASTPGDVVKAGFDPTSGILVQRDPFSEPPPPARPTPPPPPPSDSWSKLRCWCSEE
jgi:hypothetical protein